MRPGMRIGIDARCLEGNLTGIGRYVYELCLAMDSCCPAATFYLYSQNPLSVDLPSSRWVTRVEPRAFARRVKGILWLKYRLNALCAGDDLDVFWGAATFLPKFARKVSLVSTVYDLNSVVVPHTMPLFTRFAHELFFKNDVRRADIIVAISHGTAQRLQRTYGVSASAVICPAASPWFQPQSREVVLSMRSRYKLNRPYVLAVATREPRKNLESLLLAFESIRAKDQMKEYDLVLAGGGGWLDNKLNQYIRRAVQDGYIRLLGYVPDSDLPALYSGAEVFVFPSLYEGYGIPAREALACGVQVVTTDIPELREATEGAAIYIQPTIQGVADGLVYALQDSVSFRGKQVVLRQQTWAEGGAKLLEIFANSAHHHESTQ